MFRTGEGARRLLQHKKMKNNKLKKYLNARIKKEERKYNRILDVKLNQVNYLKDIDAVVVPLDQLKLEGYSFIYKNNGISFWISCYDVDINNNCVYVVKGGRKSIFKSAGVCETYQFDQIKKAAKFESWTTYKLDMIKDYDIFDARRKAQEKKPGRGCMFDLSSYYLTRKKDLQAKASKLKDERLNKSKAYELMHQALHQLEEDPANKRLSEDLDQCIYILKMISQNYNYYNYKDIINELND